MCIVNVRAGVLLLGVVWPVLAAAQTQPKSLVTRAIDETKLVFLHGSVSPLTRTAQDQGAVPDAFPAERMILMLNRPPERETALQQFLRDAHTPATATFHHWLTPQQFGAQFGPGDGDVEIASQWLAGHGFRLTKLAKSRQFLEFSGTAGQVRSAFHTEIHQYSTAQDAAGAAGPHYANATELQIPAALTGLVRGVAPMNNFRAEPQVKVEGRALYARAGKKTTPLWTTPNPYGTPNPYAFSVTPEDFATQYDLGPLYQAGVNGAGQTIGIVNESNIDLSLVQAYQSLFGVQGSMSQVVIDGDDPGPISGVDTEAYLDVELSGAVAPKATVNLYIANAGYLIDPLELAAVRAVDDNQASVLSVSFGQCEQILGTAGNQFWSQLWEQAAAQGQTVLVSSGDIGSECQFEAINTVSGLASTEWNVAVGGTDFYYSDYATGGASATTLWNTNNDANLGSLKAPLPEQPWNDAYGFDIIADGYQRGERYAGGGGASNCATVDETNGSCKSGYTKPSWQNGPGVPADGARDIPDVSLFASNGANLSAYPICAYAGECAAGSGGSAEVLLTGGTSASAPAMAGIMALVNQKYGRQGQANFTLYALAQQKPAAFHDIAVGSNSEICGGVSAPPNCILQWNGIYGTPQYPAGPGYDQASGLGSVDANVLVNQWNAVAFPPTLTSLQLSSSKVTHGTPVAVTALVTPASGSGMPTGDVAILTNSTLPANQSQTFLPLTGGSGSGSINYLPGGEYQLTGRYGGDGVYATSTSSPVSVTITQEPSKINFSQTSGNQVIATGGSVQYNIPFQLNVQPSGMNGALSKPDGIATGTATFTVDSITATVPLNAAGIAAWAPPALAPGAHTASATYSGDASFAPSSAPAVSFNVTKGPVALDGNLMGPFTWLPNTGGPSMAAGGTISVGITAQGGWTLGATPAQIPLGTATPTGTVQVCLGTDPNVAVTCMRPVYSQTVTLAPASGANYLQSGAVATFPNVAAGQYMMSASYSGDSVWQPWGLVIVEWITVGPLPPLASTTTALTASPTSFSGNETTQITATVTGTGNGGTAPNGVVSFFDEGVFLYQMLLPLNGFGATNSVTFNPTAGWFWNSGANQLTAIYTGDNGANFAPSVSNVVTLTATQTATGNFMLAPQTPQISVKSGSTATGVVNLQSLSGFNGTVSLTCTPSSTQFSCAISPASVSLNGAATATVTITANVPMSAKVEGLPGWPGAMSVLAVGVLLGFGKSRRRWRDAALVVVALVAIGTASGCGGGGGASASGPNPPGSTATPAGTYSVLVTATANGIVHNVKLTAIVQ